MENKIPSPSPYRGIFESWSDVQKHFDTSEPEPEEVLLASYDLEGYEGFAKVIYRNGETYFLVEGSHCSCYELYGQWDPESYNSKAFVRVMELRCRSSFSLPEIQEVFHRVSRKLFRRESVQKNTGV